MGVQPTGSDTLIAYAAKAGSVSYDGLGANSPFTTALVKYIAEPGLDIRIALGKVRDDVLASTNNRQEPFVYGSLGGADISLVPAPAAAVPAAPAAGSDRRHRHMNMKWPSESARGRRGNRFSPLHGSGLLRRPCPRPTRQADRRRDDGSVERCKGFRERADRLAAARRQEDERPAQAEAARPKAEQEAALQPRVDVADACPLTPDQACKRDESTLAALARQPFAGTGRAICARSRLRRFASPGPASGGKSRRRNARRRPDPCRLRPCQRRLRRSPDPACKRDEARLAKLRVESSVEQVTQFSRELTCEDLRPQVQRLMESLGAEPAAAAQSASLAPASQSKGIATSEIAEPQRRNAQAPGSAGPGAESVASLQARRRRTRPHSRQSRSRVPASPQPQSQMRGSEGPGGSFVGKRRRLAT